jgi:outer membrane protein assembly factor BamB
MRPTATNLQLPGRDNRPENLSRSMDEVRVGEFFISYADEQSNLKGSWSRFRGSDFSNIVSNDNIAEMPEGGFVQQWSFTTGEGHAAPAIHNGRVYVLDYDEALSSDMLRCFSFESGKELWRRWYRVPMKRNHGFSRTVPHVDEKYIVTIGPKGHVMCLDTPTGKLLWTLDTEKEYDTQVPFWYTGQCPLVDQGELILAAGGKEALMVGINLQTGKETWRTPNPDGYKMSHSSVIPMSVGGKRFYFYMAVGAMCGISAETADRGKLLFAQGKWQPSVVAPSPLLLPNNRVLLVAGYGSGGAALDIARSGNGLTATTILQHKAGGGISCEQQTPILYKNMVITVMPKDGGANRSRLVCFTPDNLTTPVWSSASDERFGLGPYMVIGDKLLALEDEGSLFMYKIEPRKLSLMGRQKVFDGIDAWGPMAYADGYLVLRDSHRVVCLRVK